MEFSLLANEYWWGGMVEKGIEMPFHQQSKVCLDLRRTDHYNQVSPFFLSSRGRILWSQKPFSVAFDKGKVFVDGIAQLETVGNCLREAYLYGASHCFPFVSNIPDAMFFSAPQYNTWIELMHDQNQEAIIAYARNIIAHGMPPGILMIDDGWALDYGEFTFHPGKFSDPKKMVETLHEMGFRVMLWVCPYVSPDSPVFRELQAQDYLILRQDGRPAVGCWWNGISAGIDLFSEKAVGWFTGKLKKMMQEYGIDGFKFDGGDMEFYASAEAPEKSWRYTEKYGLLGEVFAFNEYRAAWNLGGKPLVMRLSDKQHSWTENGINTLLPNSLVQGLLGYTYHCPDMIGGGEIHSFHQNRHCLDQELVVRYAQASALCPMMQFSAAPWRVLDEKHFEMVQKTVSLHQKMGEYIVGLAQHSARTGEPIMRHMAYEFPDAGCETIKDQFMLGSKILVAPVLKKGGRSRSGYLPEGVWRRNDDAVMWGGREVMMDAPLNTLLYFEREE